MLWQKNDLSAFSIWTMKNYSHLNFLQYYKASPHLLSRDIFTDWLALAFLVNQIVCVFVLVSVSNKFARSYQSLASFFRYCKHFKKVDSYKQFSAVSSHYESHLARDSTSIRKHIIWKNSNQQLYLSWKFYAGSIWSRPYHEKNNLKRARNLCLKSQKNWNGKRMQ